MTKTRKHRRKRASRFWKRFSVRGRIKSLPRIGAVLIDPNGNYMGNLLWPGVLHTRHQHALARAIVAITAQGYWANPFPEGDGVTFNCKGSGPYDADACLADFQSAFDFLDLDRLDPNEGRLGALARLAGSRTVTCTCLVPVEALRLEASLTLGKTRFHAPVDGEDNLLADHAWRDLCDIPGADVCPNWMPTSGTTGTTELLSRALIERHIKISLAALYRAEASFDGQSALLRLAMEDADHALDPIRLDLCHYLQLEYLPAKPGWIGDIAAAYIIPDSNTPKARYLLGKPYVLRASNNWLGLEVDGWNLSFSERVAASIVDNPLRDEITLALKGALRALNRSFYLVELEASFLHLVYAIDALCKPEKLRGDRHRLWISAFGSAGNANRFATLLAEFTFHYAVRNRIVHEGATFAGLGLKGEEHCQFMLVLLGSCIRTFLDNSFATQAEAAQFAFSALNGPAISNYLIPMTVKDITLPLSLDKTFKKHMQI